MHLASMTRRSRVFVLGVGAVALIAVQALYLPTRLDLVTEGLRFSRIPDPEGRLRAALGAEMYDLLRRVGSEVPAGTPVLLVTRDAGTHPPYAPYVLYHRALYHLYPRRVWWAVVEPPRRVPAWWLSTSGRPDEVVELAERLGAGAAVTIGLPDRSQSAVDSGSSANVEIRVLERVP